MDNVVVFCCYSQQAHRKPKEAAPSYTPARASALSTLALIKTNLKNRIRERKRSIQMKQHN